MNTVGERIKIIRTKNKLKQKDFADRVFVSASYISMLESGKETPTDMLLKLIALDFNVSFSWLKDGSGEMSFKTGYDYFERNNTNDLHAGVVEKLEQFSDILQNINVPSINMNTIGFILQLNDLVMRHASNPTFLILIYEQITNIILSTCEVIQHLDEGELDPHTVNQLYKLLRSAAEDNYDLLMEVGALYEKILFKD